MAGGDGLHDDAAAPASAAAVISAPLAPGYIETISTGGSAEAVSGMCSRRAGARWNVTLSFTTEPR
ncbi:hypothetical protein ALISP_1131 [Alicycliphilus sp. B1]|nr:hypothetical protein ALISP_1131 [Alicycliphilus sp. B1]